MTEPADKREPDQLDGVTLPEQQQLLVGHEAAKQTIDGLIATGRIPGAILLHGPTGIGKATLAFALARDILTQTGDEDAHRVAEQVAAVSHPNLFVLRKQPRDSGKGFYTVIRVDEVRALKERMQRTRGRAGYRVAVIDAIDDCNPSAANALLKMLEEPPTETVFLLISHRPGSLLPTIRSRCQSLALRPLSDAQVREVLLAQRPDAEDAKLDAAVDLADGRPRRGFEALAMSNEGALGALRGWLRDPLRHPSAVHLGLADTLLADKASAEAAFARDMVLEWIAAEARAAAIAGGARARLASVNDLWDKANALFADAEEYNLDAKQTLIAIFDAIRRHIQHTAAPAEQT